MIEKGLRIFIPILSIHHDAGKSNLKHNLIKFYFNNFLEYYHDPKKFIPERFDVEHGGVKAFKDRGVLIPFGDGPRICLVKFLSKSKFS